MNVKELVNILKRADDDAPVFIDVQTNGDNRGALIHTLHEINVINIDIFTAGSESVSLVLRP